MTEDQRHNPKLLWAITGSLIVVIIAVFIFQWMGSADNDTDMQATPPVTDPAAKSAPPKATSLQDAEAAPKQLVTEDLLKAPVPENAALAKEEVAKLDDIRNQLNDQSSLLKQQHADADELIKLKEEQIKILEAQLAQ